MTSKMTLDEWIADPAAAPCRFVDDRGRPVRVWRAGDDGYVVDTPDWRLGARALGLRLAYDRRRAVEVERADDGGVTQDGEGGERA